MTMYRYEWVPGGLAADGLVDQMSDLYSNHYGLWGARSHRPGMRVELSAERVREWLAAGDTRISLAYASGVLIGYAISARKKTRRGIVSWVTQMVVHEKHQHRGVGKSLLFSTWGFTDHFAWGLLTANPYAVRALEKATRRRCQPSRIAQNKRMLTSLARELVPYWHDSTTAKVGDDGSTANTRFFLDHTLVEERLRRVTSESAPWVLGPLREGWEWFAFTFRDQEQLGLSEAEITRMVAATDQVTRTAYSRMTLDSQHKWAAHEAKEAAQIREWCDVGKNSVVLDLGCGNGRHAIELASACKRVIGVDYVGELCAQAARSAHDAKLVNVSFVQGDCRDLPISATFDAVLCLYDVVGSHVDELDNVKILRSIAARLRKGGRALISVMNMAYTRRHAIHWFTLRGSPDRLLELPASTAMESTGDIFDPNYYLVDEETGVVYRKEQFDIGSELPAEYVVADRRYEEHVLLECCSNVGLRPIWSRPVRAGTWETPRDQHEAKEILVLCERV